MKRITTLLAGLGLAISLFAQSPQKISYQAVIRNSNNLLVTNATVGMRFNILKGSVSGGSVYTETQTPLTNANGLITVEIGSGNITFGDLSLINWADGPYFLKTETDPAGGTNYSLTGTSQLLSVPYAFYAAKAGNGFSGSYNDLTNKPSLFDGTWLSLTGKPNFATVSTSGSYNDLFNKPIINGSETKVTAGINISVTGTGTSATPYVVNLNIAHHVGEMYGGGVIFYVDNTGQHGLIVSIDELSNNQSWSNVSSTQIGISAQSTWNGQNNTTAIVNQAGHSNSAAQLCNDYVNTNFGTGVYSDWYLPSVYELSLLFDAKYEVNKALDNDGNSSTLAFWLQAVYWSSSERDANNAYYLQFQNSSVGYSGKYNFLFVRAVRNF
jgi:hypothetical protein